MVTAVANMTAGLGTYEPGGKDRSVTARRCSTTPAAERKPCQARARLIMRRRLLRDSARIALANCTADIKSIVEGTTGFWYKPYNGPKGRLQMGMQYSYLVRTAWVGYGAPPYTTLPPSSTTAPKAIENMWFTSFRYYLP